MSNQDSAPQLRFNLKVGDLIHAKVTKLGGGSHQVDTSRWANVETATIEEFNETGSVYLGSHIYAKTERIDDDSASLVQAERVYQRHHLPGDELRIQAIDKSSSHLCRADLDKKRNLNRLYVAGTDLGAEATVEIVKIRQGTAIAVPNKIHCEGITTGLKLSVETESGSRDVKISEFSDRDGTSFLSDIVTTAELTEPARATGTAHARIIKITSEKIECDLTDYHLGDLSSLPTTGDCLRVDIDKDDKETIANISENVSVGIQFSERAPCAGTVLVALSGFRDGVYRGAIKKYVKPDIQVGNIYDGNVYEYKNAARIEPEGYRVPVSLENDITATGTTKIKVTEISDSVCGRIVGNIDKKNVGSDDSSGVDLTNLSKL